MKKHIPNFITSLNLLCGCIGIGLAFKDNLAFKEDFILAVYMIGFAAIFDFLDGMVARLLNVKSDIGKELDSLADVVSFGVLPGVILFCLLSNAYSETTGFVSFLPFVAFLIPVFSALRLAKFNIDTRQTNSFIGLPTPANAIFIGSIPLIIAGGDSQSFIQNIFSNPGFLVMLIFLMSYLLVSPIPLFSMKFKDMSWAGNKVQYIFIIITVIFLLLFKFTAIPLILFVYIFLSIFQNSIKK
ncbi:MAG: CDP-diacylglycerol--serine O-phosphatidyltransferase [Bacteroidetes bacterium]|nr:CDP-diacylglycerol--serine O-phosphatidyltransferase [Bacteroidota bacterium]